MKNFSVIATVLVCGSLLAGCNQDAAEEKQAAVLTQQSILDKASETTDAAKSLAADARDKVESMADVAREKTEDAVAMAQDAAADIKQNAEKAAELSADKAKELKDAAADSELMKKAEDAKNTLLEMSK